MSWATLTHLICDGKDCERIISYGLDQVWETRARAREDGWVTRADSDYCPECARKLKGDDDSS